MNILLKENELIKFIYEDSFVILEELQKCQKMILGNCLNRNKNKESKHLNKFKRLNKIPYILNFKNLGIIFLQFILSQVLKLPATIFKNHKLNLILKITLKVLILKKKIAINSKQNKKIAISMMKVV